MFRLAPGRSPTTKPRAGAKDRLGIASIESWPAAGGGLLVGVAEPALAGTVPLRGVLKTLFIRIDSADTVSLIVPYANFEPEAATCMVALVAGELRLPPARIALDTMIDKPRHIIDREPARRPLVDLGRDAERSIGACAAIARVLLTEAAAQVWGARRADCRIADGIIGLGKTRRALRYGEVAHLAALVQLPGDVALRLAAC